MNELQNDLQFLINDTENDSEEFKEIVYNKLYSAGDDLVKRMRTQLILIGMEDETLSGALSAIHQCLMGLPQLVEHFLQSSEDILKKSVFQ